MTSKQTKINNDVYSAIARVISNVCNNPLIYFSETDIHVLMMQALLEISGYNKLYKTGVSIGRNKKGFASKDTYRTMLVHREYGKNTGEGQRSDIVVFHANDVKKITDPKKLMSAENYLNPQYVFEFGTEKSAEPIELFDAHLEKDFGKLLYSINNGAEKGFLIHIHRFWAKSSRETGRYKNHKNKIDQFMNETGKLWKKYRDTNNLVPLIFFVNIGVTARNENSKVSIFDPYGQEEFIRVNLKIIQKAVRNILKHKQALP